MRCLNSPPILNSLEAKIVESVPTISRHVLVVNAGDGRLARAVREKLNGGVVSVVTIQPGLRHFVDDFAGGGSDPWDMNWYAAQQKAHGAFDFVIFYHLHEFWSGEIFSLQRILQLAQPGATVWASFLNAQSHRMIGRFLPPVRLGFSSLADPLRASPNVDFASYLDFVGKIGGGITELWGMLDKNAQEFCQNPPKQPVQWDSRGVKVKVGTFADAFLWGAAFVGVAFQARGGEAPATPKISFAPYSTNLLQALALPYPDVQTREGVLGAAQFEVEAWKKAPAESIGALARFLLGQVGETDKPKRVLLFGSGWGRDLLLLKRQYPAWDWVGFDADPELAALGGDLLGAAGIVSTSAVAGEAMPFEDKSFDLAVSLGNFSTLHEPAARHWAKELRRVVKGSIHHLEDGRGPDQGMQLKSYSLKAVYSDLGNETSVQPVLVDGSPIGMYLLKVAAPA